MLQSNSSTESDTIPFANENAGTIKQRTIRSTNGKWVILIICFMKNNIFNQQNFRIDSTDAC